MDLLQAPYRRAGPASKLILCLSSIRRSQFLGLWLVGKYEWYIVIEVIEVDELHEGKILSSSSTSMTISAVAELVR